MKTPRLSDLRQSDLEEIVFPGGDAAVYFARDGQDLPSEVKEAFARYPHSHWHPVTGGHNVKAPSIIAQGVESHFEIEKNGWSVDDCDFCQADIAAGARCWQANFHGRLFLVCEACHPKIRSRRWWQFMR